MAAKAALLQIGHTIQSYWQVTHNTTCGLWFLECFKDKQIAIFEFHSQARLQSLQLESVIDWHALQKTRRRVCTTLLRLCSSTSTVTGTLILYPYSTIVQILQSSVLYSPCWVLWSLEYSELEKQKLICKNFFIARNCTGSQAIAAWAWHCWDYVAAVKTW